MAVATVMAVVLVVATACAGSDSTSTSGGAEGSRTLRIAFASSPDFTQVSNFKWIKDLRDSGVDVKDLYFQSSQDAFRALVSGEADVALGTVTSAILLNMSAGENVKVIASDLQAPDYILVTTPEITKDADLQGKRIGISTPGDVSDTLTRLVLESRGVDTSKIDFVEIGGTGARMQALLSNQISGGAAHAAEGLAAVGQGLKDLFAYGQTIPDYLQHGLIVQQSWIDKNKDFVQEMVDSFIESTRWAADNKDAYIKLSQENVDGIDDQVRSQAYDIFKSINMFAINGGMEDRQLNTTVDIEKKVGTFEDKEMPPLSAWSDPTYVQNYLQRNGSV
jgi:NitT/TauT family transport system substrate-binding protein